MLNLFSLRALEVEEEGVMEVMEDMAMVVVEDMEDMGMESEVQRTQMKKSNQSKNLQL